MSTKTTFKRVALVAVAALGLGVLSVAPSSAAPAGVAVTATAGTSTLTGNTTDSTTAATFNLKGIVTVGDSITAELITKSVPAGGSTTVNIHNLDSATPTNTTARLHKGTKASTTAFAVLDTSTTGFVLGVNSGTASLDYNFGVQLDSTTAGRVAGTYVFSLLVNTYESGTAAPKQQIVQDITITIAAAASDSKTIDPSKSTAIMSLGSSFVSGTTSDSAVALVSTVASADQAVIRVVTQNSSSIGRAESITATVTGAGVIGVAGGTVFGKNITVAGTGSTDLAIRADGTAGTGSIVIKTTTVTFAAKTVTFFAKSAKTITLAVNKPVIAVGSSLDTIRATALDADGNVWGGAAYIYADTAADALIAGSNATPAACTFNSAKAYHECPVSGTAKGTANLKVIDAATVALATATSAAAAVRVSTGVPTTAKISFDAATYAPSAKATVLVTVLDADGLALPTSTITNAFAADIVSSVAFSSGSLSGSASPVLAAATSSSSATTAGSAQYTVYMPAASGVVTLTATGSTGLASAGRVAVTASAEVVNSSVDAATDAANEATDAANAATDAALAAADAADAATAAAQDASDAVAALSASVSKLISSLRAQITSLTNLVIKIQKKVKA